MGRLSFRSSFLIIFLETCPLGDTISINQNSFIPFTGSNGINYSIIIWIAHHLQNAKLYPRQNLPRQKFSLQI